MIENPDPTPQHTKLARNETMARLTYFIANYQPNISVIKRRLRHLIDKHKIKLNDTTKQGIVGEEVVNQTIIDYAHRDRRVIHHPMQTGIQLDKTLIRYNVNNQIKVIDRHTGDELSELDAVALCNDVPLLIEVKMTEMRIKHAISQHTVSRRLSIIQDYFKTSEVGYGIVVFPELIDEPNHAYLQDFEQMGGIVIPFCMTKKAYSRFLEKV